MSDTLQRRRVAVFLGVAFGLSWLTALLIYLTGGLDAGPMLLPGVPQSLVLVAGPYMFAPAVANVATRIATGEGFDRTLLRPHVRARWRSYLVAWLAPVGLVVVGAVLYFLVRPGQFGGLDAVGSFVPVVDGSPAISPDAFLALQIGQLLVIAPLVNAPFTFGEEFGWRGYLLPKLLPLGRRRALLAHGVIWGGGTGPSSPWGTTTASTTPARPSSGWC